jgi:hypothetical protein
VGELQWERLALTDEQVYHYDLPRIIKTDRRFKNGRGTHEAAETKTLLQRITIDIIRERLEAAAGTAGKRSYERAQQEGSRIRLLIEMGE